MALSWTCILTRGIVNCIFEPVFNDCCYARNRRLVGGFEFYIILANSQNSFCIIAFCGKVFCQQLLPEIVELSFLKTINTSFGNYQLLT